MEKRDETEAERLDRNTQELVNELRVAGTGVQVLFAFLLVVPFNNRWTKLTRFDRIDYYVTLFCVAISAILLIAPSVHHRVLFRYGLKEYIVEFGSRLAIAAAAFLAVGLTGILVLMTNFLISGTGAVIVGLCAGGLLSGLWFALPLRKRRSAE